jgi:Protein of unknown function (DUF4038)/Putative collagen-binding domain of a collagenase
VALQGLSGLAGHEGSPNMTMASCNRRSFFLQSASLSSVPGILKGLSTHPLRGSAAPGLAAGVGSPGSAAVRSMPKLRVRASNRHLLEDENGKPFFVAGVCPQNMVHWLTREQMDAYFADRRARLFNCAWVVINAFLTGNFPATNPVDAHGNTMLLKGTSWDPQNLNPAYVATVDAMVQSAARHGIYLFLDPFSAAYGHREGSFYPEQHSHEEMRQWGEFWGKRYQDYTHVNFVLGNDRLVAPQVDEVASGLMKYMPDRLMTTDWIGGPPDYNSDRTGPHRFYDLGHRWVNFNAWYQYHAPQWATWSHYNMTDPVMPTCIWETFYEHCDFGNPKPNPTIPLLMRQEVWAAVLGGGSGFGILGSPDGIEDPMKWLGKTPGLEQAQNCTEFFKTRRWYEMKPDWSHAFLTSQKGTPREEDFTYVSAALTGDGTLGVCYYPGTIGSASTTMFDTTWGYPLTVNMSRMGSGAGHSRARWYDPTNGTYRTIGRIANSGSHTFTTPLVNSKGDFDWVLALEKD